MGFAVCRIAILCLVLTPRMTEVGGKSLKIIIPHKIRYIHYHHSDPTGMKFKKKFERPLQIPRFQHVSHEEDESEEEVEEPLDWYHTEDHDDEDFDAAEEGDPYYDLPIPEFYNNVLRFMPRPARLHNTAYRRARLSARHEDYLQRLRLPEEPPTNEVWF